MLAASVALTRVVAGEAVLQTSEVSSADECEHRPCCDEAVNIRAIANKVV